MVREITKSITSFILKEEMLPLFPLTMKDNTVVNSDIWFTEKVMWFERIINILEIYTLSEAVFYLLTIKIDSKFPVSENHCTFYILTRMCDSANYLFLITLHK
jgi:hypothetical protein